MPLPLLLLAAGYTAAATTTSTTTVATVSAAMGASAVALGGSLFWYFSGSKPEPAPPEPPTVPSIPNQNTLVVPALVRTNLETDQAQQQEVLRIIPEIVQIQEEPHIDEPVQNIRVELSAAVANRNNDIIVANIADNIIDDILLRKLKGKLDPEALKSWISLELSKNDGFIVSEDILNNASFINQLSIEIQHSLEDKEIIAINQESIYRSRISIGLWDWLYNSKNNQAVLLTETQREAYELSMSIWKYLEQLRKRKNRSTKKPSFERLLILKVLLTHAHLNAILQNQKSASESNFVEHVASRKYHFEKHPDKDHPGNYESLSRDPLTQRNYTRLIKQAVDNWCAQHIPEYSAAGFKKGTPAILTREGMPSFSDHLFNSSQDFFIDTFSRKMDDLYCKFHAIDLDLVIRKPEGVDKIADVIDHYSGNLTILNAPGFELIAHMLAEALRYLKGVSIANMANRMSRLFANLTPLQRGEIFNTAAQAIAFRYQHQFNQLTPGAIQELACCAAYRAVEYITRCDANLVVAAPGFFASKGAVIVDYFCGMKHAPKLTARNEVPLTIIMAGVIDGRSKQDEHFMSTKNGDTWRPSNVFNNTGIITKNTEGELVLYTHDRLQKNPDGAPAFGYCFASTEEAIKGGYKLDYSTPLEVAMNMFVENRILQAAIMAPFP